MEGRTMLEDIKLFTMDEVADVLRLSRRTIAREINKGRLRATKVGDLKVFITEDAIRDYLNGRKCSPK